MRDDVRSPVPSPLAESTQGGEGSSERGSGRVSDSELLGRIAEGDAGALAPLYERHRRRVYQFALLWTGQAATAADVAQDVFMHALTHARDFDPDRGAPLAWMLGIARNFARRRTSTVDVVAADEDAEPPSPFGDERADPETRLAARRDVDRLRTAIAALPPHYRDVLVLVELAERSYAEAALICGCELNTVRSRLSRARALLARWLGTEARTPTPPPL
jgi:RNA polymerase sigma-70 factor (ECF subfamily)